MEKLLKTAGMAAIDAGKEIMRIYLDPNQDFDIQKKTDNSPLTRADRAAHKCIVKQLEQTGIPILSEEGTLPPYEVRKEWHRVWLVDPLDGTKEFIKQNGEFTVNIALIEDGKPVGGIIFVPVTGMLYYGHVGVGAWKVKIDASFPSTSPLEIVRIADKRTIQEQVTEKPFTIVASRSHLSVETEYFIKQMRQKHREVEVISSGSSLKMCLVAEGKADVYPRFAPTMEWDTAAGDAIVRAVGGEVVDANTELPLTYNKPDLHNPWFIVR